MHPNGRGKRAQVIQDEQSMILAGNHNALKELADHEKEPIYVDQSIIQKDNKIATT